MRNVRGRSRWRLRGRRSVRERESERERLASWRAAASWPSGWDVVCTKPTKGNNSEPLIKNNMTAIKLNLLPKCRQAALATPRSPSLPLTLIHSVSVSVSVSVCVCVRKNYDSGSRAPGQPVSGNTYTQSVQSKANEREIEECEKGCVQGNRQKHRSGKTSERISCCHFICQFLFLFQLQLSF